MNAPGIVRTSLLFVLGVPLALCLAWSYWPTLVGIADRWASDPSYSHGFLVPLFSVYLLWLRRQKLKGASLTPHWFGLAVLGLALVMRLGGAYYHFAWFDQLSLLPALAGLFLLVGGWSILAWAGPALAFLVFMIPLPHTLSLAMSGPMQSVATQASTFCLQVLGRPALAEGNVILLNDVELGIVEACSGLRMLVVFFALSTGMAMLMQKPLWEKLLVAASAVPIALVANIVRITATGLVFDVIGAESAQALVHDLAGWLMMPLGLVLLGLERLLLSRLLIDPPPSAPALVVEVSQQRVAVDALAMYRSPAGTRRQRAAETKPITPAETPV